MYHFQKYFWFKRRHYCFVFLFGPHLGGASGIRKGCGLGSFLVVLGDEPFSKSILQPTGLCKLIRWGCPEVVYTFQGHIFMVEIETLREVGIKIPTFAGGPKKLMVVFTLEEYFWQLWQFLVGRGANHKKNSVSWSWKLGSCKEEVLEGVGKNTWKMLEGNLSSWIHLPKQWWSELVLMGLVCLCK